MMKKMGISFSALILSAVLLSLTTRPDASAQKYGPAQKTQNGVGLKASIERGKKVYAEQCLSCHQVDALGVSGMTPPLVKTKWVLGDKTTLVRIVLKGLTGEIEIDGDTYHNVMAPHSELTNRQIADVLTYVRNSFGNKAKAITPAEVAAIRAKTK
jgi:mono/diheme cytochrome c family protein